MAGMRRGRTGRKNKTGRKTGAGRRVFLALLGAGCFLAAAPPVTAQAGMWMDLDGKRYLVSEAGTLLTGWQQQDGSWYYLEADGCMKTGWLEENGAWYYLEETGAMAAGWRRIGGKYYYFRENGTMQDVTLYQNGTQYTFGGDGSLTRAKKERNTGGGSYEIGFFDADRQAMADSLNELKKEAFDGDEEEDYYEDEKVDYDKDASFVLSGTLQEIAEHRLEAARSRGYGSGRIPDEGTISDYLEAAGYGKGRRHLEIYLINCDGATQAEEKLLRKHGSDERERKDRAVYYKEMGIAHETVNGRDYYMIELMR